MIVDRLKKKTIPPVSADGVDDCRIIRLAYLQICRPIHSVFCSNGQNINAVRTDFDNSSRAPAYRRAFSAEADGMVPADEIIDDKKTASAVCGMNKRTAGWPLTRALRSSSSPSARGQPAVRSCRRCKADRQTSLQSVHAAGARSQQADHQSCRRFVPKLL